MKNRNDQIQNLIWESNVAFQDLSDVLATIRKEEAQWMPTPKSRTLETIQNWNKFGESWLDEQNFDPLPTIEYLVLHLAHCKIMYNDYAFREATLQWKDLECPKWPESRRFLRKAHDISVKSFKVISDQELKNTVKTNWGDLWPIKKVIYTLIYHDAYHLGQINLIRNIFSIRSESYYML